MNPPSPEQAKGQGDGGEVPAKRGRALENALRESQPPSTAVTHQGREPGSKVAGVEPGLTTKLTAWASRGFGCSDTAPRPEPPFQSAGQAVGRHKSKICLGPWLRRIWIWII